MLMNTKQEHVNERKIFISNQQMELWNITQIFQEHMFVDFLSFAIIMKSKTNILGMCEENLSHKRFWKLIQNFMRGDIITHACFCEINHLMLS